MLKTSTLFSALKLFFLLFTLVLTGCVTTGSGYANRTQVQMFIDEMVTKHDFNRGQLVSMFSQVKTREHVVKSMQAPKEDTSLWYNYRAIFIQPERIQQGVDFWHEHADTLARAEQQYGVPPQIIIAILGVETRFGRLQGKESAFNSLSLFAFDYPRRAAYFRSELEQYLLLTREMSLDPMIVKSSYAGALGEPQFMPSSYRRFAIDSNGKGYSDLFNNQDDIILSVANYFNAHGWQANGLVTLPANVKGERYEKLPIQTNNPAMTLNQLTKYGVRCIKPLSGNELASLLILDGQVGKEYWLRFHNFQVITRYNSSPLYAMAVYQLSEKIKERYLTGVNT